jgi:hypothetical protein
MSRDVIEQLSAIGSAMERTSSPIDIGDVHSRSGLRARSIPTRRLLPFGRQVSVGLAAGFGDRRSVCSVGGRAGAHRPSYRGWTR